MYKAPLDLNTAGGLFGAIIDSKFETRQQAASRMGLNATAISGTVRGVNTLNMDWLERTHGKASVTPLDVLKTCPAWSEHGEKLVTMITEAEQKRSVERQVHKSLTSHARSHTQWRAAVSETVRKIREFSGDTIGDLRDDPTLARHVSEVLEKVESGKTERDIDFISAARCVCTLYSLGSFAQPGNGKELTPRAKVPAKMQPLYDHYQQLRKLVPQII
jgi:hypothetical protein